ncbi:MAG TPA: DoxX family protein, partial [Rhizomicrobium sp.]|nr:DoxX family protein [Rhizomicrobium sp.]
STQNLAMLIGRALMSAIFIWSGYAKLISQAATQDYFAHIGLPVPMFAWLVTVAIEFAGGIALLVGVQTRIIGLVLALWCIATAIVGHSDFSNPGMQIHFMKNVAMCGGLIYIAMFGGGFYSVDRVLRRQ